MKAKRPLAVLAALSLSICGLSPAFAQAENLSTSDFDAMTSGEFLDFIALTVDGPAFVPVAEPVTDVADAPDAPGPQIAFGGPEHGGKGWEHHGPLEGALAITDDQAEKMHQLRMDYMDAMGPKNLELHKLERHMKDTLMNADLDSGKAKSMGNEIASLKSDLSKMRTEHLIACANVLTSDQRKAIRLAVIRHHGHHHMGGHHHGGPGPGHPPMAGGGPDGPMAD